MKKIVIEGEEVNRIINSNFPLPEKVRKGLKKPSVTFDELISSLSIVLTQYDKCSILKWIYSTSLLPGNEIYESRFVFLKQLILSIPDSTFSTKKVNELWN